MNKKAIVVGFGTIGRPLCQALLQNGWDVAYVLTSKGTFLLQEGKIETKIGEIAEYAKVLDEVEAVCIALSVPDDGTAEYTYMLPALRKGKAVITCAKRGLANHPDLYKYATSTRPLLGIDATVGGNSGILRHLRSRLNPKLPVEIHLIVNASMNCFMFEVSDGGNTPSEAMEEVRRRGLAEPVKQKRKFAPFFRGETDDTIFKTSIIVNYCRLFREPTMMASQVSAIRYLDEDILQQLFRSKNRRYIVSLFRGNAPTEDVIGGFTHVVPGQQSPLCISAGFKRVDVEPYARLKIPGACNAAYTIEGENGRNGTSYIQGIGAGPDPTVAAILSPE